jgi:peptide/nickel transport system ATP-binding protein
LLRVANLTKVFHQHGTVQALRDVTVSIWSGETLGLVGESGSGKTTLAHMLAGILEPTAGAIELDGRRLASRVETRAISQVRDLQLVFQNPDSALNRSHRVGRILRHAIRQLAGLTGDAIDRRLLELTKSVRIADRYLSVRPRHLSGGLKQRVAIAAAFAGDPRLVVCDEPTSALDVSVQAAILNLLADLQAERRVSYLFVMYLGRLMEVGTADKVFGGPHHPYTEALVSAVPSVGGAVRQRIRLKGDIPSAATPPSGCVFHTRCHRKIGAICEGQEPPLIEAEPEHLLRCHLPLDQLGYMGRPGRALSQPAERDTA